MNTKVNMAIQVLPLKNGEISYSVVDKAIDIIKKTGFEYRVCPFETVVEGEFKELLKLVEKIHYECYKDGASSMLCYLKIETSAGNEVKINDKIGKYL